MQTPKGLISRSGVTRIPMAYILAIIMFAAGLIVGIIGTNSTTAVVFMSVGLALSVVSLWIHETYINSRFMMSSLLVVVASIAFGAAGLSLVSMIMGVGLMALIGLAHAGIAFSTIWNRATMMKRANASPSLVALSVHRDLRTGVVDLRGLAA